MTAPPSAFSAAWLFGNTDSPSEMARIAKVYFIPAPIMFIKNCERTQEYNRKCHVGRIYLKWGIRWIPAFDKFTAKIVAGFRIEYLYILGCEVGMNKYSKYIVLIVSVSMFSGCDQFGTVDEVAVDAYASAHALAKILGPEIEGGALNTDIPYVLDQSVTDSSPVSTSSMDFYCGASTTIWWTTDAYSYSGDINVTVYGASTLTYAVTVTSATSNESTGDKIKDSADYTILDPVSGETLTVQYRFKKVYTFSSSCQQELTGADATYTITGSLGTVVATRDMSMPNWNIQYTNANGDIQSASIIGSDAIDRFNAR